MPDFSNRLLARFAGQRFSYRWYSDIQLARQGIVLEQNKEPALSGGIQRICSRTLDHVPIDDLQEGDDIVTIARKAVAIGGSWMVKSDIIKSGDFDKVEALTKEAVKKLREVR